MKTLYDFDDLRLYVQYRISLEMLYYYRDHTYNQIKRKYNERVAGFSKIKAKRITKSLEYSIQELLPEGDEFVRHNPMDFACDCGVSMNDIENMDD